LFARNSALNLVGMLLPLVLAVVAIPPLMRGLGADRFGILTLAWAAIGYFGLFEFGLSRALTQAVAHRIGRSLEHEVPALAWSGLLLLLALGILGALLVAAATTSLVTGVLNVPATLRRETVISFYVLAASLPFVVTTAGMRGLMEAHQHFGTATLLRVPLMALMLVGPLLVLPFSNSLVPAVLMLAAGRVIGFAAHVIVCFRRYEYLRKAPLRVFGAAPIRPLLRYGGWTTLTNVVSPIMSYLDRFLIGALLPIAAVAHYVTPYELVTKFSVVPAACLAAMFPAFAATFASDQQRMAQLYDRALRAVMLVTFPVVLVIVTLAREGMNLWMGNALPPESATVLQWLAVGVFVNAIAQSPFAALQGAGRPDLIAKLHLVELPVYVAFIIILARSNGLVGVAIAWTLRVAVDAIALLLISRRTLALSMGQTPGGAWPAPLMIAALVVGAMLTSTSLRTVYIIVVGIFFIIIGWRRLLTPQERVSLIDWVRSPGAVVAPTIHTPSS
jgi:O-antigen/teichoic acid export membrane protein